MPPIGSIGEGDVGLEKIDKASPTEEGGEAKTERCLIPGVSRTFGLTN